MKEILFTVNGPGEIHAFTIPLAMAFRQLLGVEVKLSLFLLPCQFSSGFEEKIASDSGLFDNILTTVEYKRFFSKGELPSHYLPEIEGVVFYNGGDSWHAQKLAKHLGWRVFAYDEGNLRRRKKFDKIFTKDIDGNLMIDSAQMRKYYYSGNPIGAKNISLALFPGSRKHFLDFTIPFYQKIGKLAKQKYPQLNIFFVVGEDLREYFNNFDDDFEVRSPFQEYNIDLALTLVGTNTAVLGAKGVPMVALLPLNRAEIIPLTGILGLIGKTFIGKFIKRKLLQLMTNRKKLYAIPNVNRQSMIVPELVGVLTPEAVFAQLDKLLLDVNARNRMSLEIRDIIGKPGAALRISKEVVRIL